MVMLIVGIIIGAAATLCVGWLVCAMTEEDEECDG